MSSSFGRIPLTETQNHIALMTRKNHGDVVQVLQMLRLRGRLGSWKLLPIEPQDGVARLMEEAKIFLSFGDPEGISLSNLEAMSRGCRVIGYSGMGCREYFAQDRCHEIQIGDVAAFAQAVAEDIARCDRGCPALEAGLGASARHVRERYSPERERSDLLEFYSWLLTESA